MLDRIRMSFAALREGRSAGKVKGLNVLPIEVEGSVVRLGVDDDLRPHLLAPVAGGEVAPNGLSALTSSITELNIDGSVLRLLDVRCEVPGLAEVFDHLIAAVLEKVALGTPPGEATVAVVDRWRKFLEPAASPPTHAVLTGLFGELIVLTDLAAVDAPKALGSWVGPRGGRHDFRRGPWALEVKTTRAHTARTVTIHGEDQLLAPDDGRLYLQLIRIEEVAEGGSSVPDLVDRLISRGAPAGETYSAVADAGLGIADYTMAAKTRFDVRERTTVPVDKESPRIIPSSFIGGARPIGVVDLTYRLDLDHVLDRALSDEEYGEFITALVTTEAGR